MVGVDAAASSATTPASCSAVAHIKRIPSLLLMSLSASLQKNSRQLIFLLSSLLLVGARDHFQMEHDTRHNDGKILNLATIVGFALEGKVHRQACIHEGTPFAIPSDNCLVGLEMAARDKCPLAVIIDVGDKIVDQHPMIPLRQHAVWLLGWLTRPPDGIPDVIKVVKRHTRCTQVVGGEVLGGGTAALPELVAFAAEIYACNQHTHANVNSNTRSSCSGGIMWTNAASGDMSAKLGFPGAILLPDGPFWYH